MTQAAKQPTFGAEKVVGDVRGIIDADADADDEHRGGDRVYRDICKRRRRSSLKETIHHAFLL